jgi:NAD+ diphosphatase
MSRFAFDGTLHNRMGHRRGDADWQAGAQFMLLGGEHVATVDGPAVRWFAIEELPEGQRLLVGEQDGQTYGAVIVERVDRVFAPTSVRVLAPLLEPKELSLAVHAVGMARWLASTPYCPRCGGATDIRQSGHVRHCAQCGVDHFPRTDPAVIVAITDPVTDSLLLARNTAWPQKRFSTLAGFVEPGESLEDAVVREVAEEVGVTVAAVRYAASQPWPFPASIMIGFFGEASDTRITVDHDEIAEARWFTRTELHDLMDNGEVLLPPRGVSISSWLIEEWLGDRIASAWF